MSRQSGSQKNYYLEIFLVCMGALILEISHTRLISFKLFYYFTYFIIGSALLGIGFGGVIVALSKRLRAASLDRIIAVASLCAALSIVIGYFVIAHVPIDTASLLSWGAQAPASFLAFVCMCLAMFSAFIFVGIVVSSLFGQMPDDVPRLYFADLLGAGLACAIIVPLLSVVAIPQAIFLSAAIVATAAWRTGPRVSPTLGKFSRTVVVGTVLLAIFGGMLPDGWTEPRPDAKKTVDKGYTRRFSEWNPVFRVDVTDNTFDPEDKAKIVHHDGLWGSTLQRWDGSNEGLERFAARSHSFPYRIATKVPEHVLIIGAAGGHEILGGLHGGAGKITAVELNPVTFSLTEKHFADYTGHLHEHPRVDFINAEGRSFLERDDTKYDLIFFVAPDSYAAQNATTSGAFVLSESYLYTVEMINTALDHLAPGGMLSMQFGEYLFDQRPNRTIRYLSTARAAFSSRGIDDPSDYTLVATTPDLLQLSTIMMKAEPFTAQEITNFKEAAASIANSTVRYVPGEMIEDGPVHSLLTTDVDALDAWYDSYPYNAEPIYDDAPFFWHFVPFREILRTLFTPLHELQTVDTEMAIGERIILLLLLFAATFAGIFLLLPFIAIRKTWAELPKKRISGLYFSSLGMGFMLFEVYLIQRLTLMLGYPTYSLTITLMGLLIFTGVGSLLTGRFSDNPNIATKILLPVLTGLTVFYLFGLGPVIDAMFSFGLLARMGVALILIAPLGLCLGAFMPLGIAQISRMTQHEEIYIAWAWAVNGFFSVIGSVLTTILSMMFGFRVVMLIGLAVYFTAGFALNRLAER